MKNTMDDVPIAVNSTFTRLLDRLRLFMRARYMAWATEKTYLLWVRRYILFHKKRHSAEMGAAEIEGFLNHLALVSGVAPATQAIALNALVFLYRQFLQQDLGQLTYQAARSKQRVPVVFSHDEATAVIGGLQGSYRVMGMLMYGSGLHVLECLRLRVKDIDFSLQQIIVRDGKGGKDRRSILPVSATVLLQQQTQRRATIYALFRNCSDTVILKLPRFIRMF
jgi:site-specific recombinase XerD